MHGQLKYIVIKPAVAKGNHKDKEVLITFPNHINHDWMFEAARRMRDQTHGNWTRVTYDIVSAGFVDAYLNCHGRSETLDVDSRGDTDTLLLRSQLN